jgi:hypothetical protein
VIGCVHNAPNKHVLLFCVRLQYHDMNIFMIRIVDDLKKVVIWLNIRDCSLVISNGAHIVYPTY